MSTEIVFVKLHKFDCGKCGGTYAINEQFRANCQQEGTGWTCPYCKTSWGYFRDNDNAKLKREIEDLKRQRDSARHSRDYYEKEADHFRRSRDGMKGALVKVKKRVGKGACPCCNRFFKNLAAHMDTQHPEYGGSIQDV